MNFLTSNDTIHFRFFITLCFLFSYVNPVYAIPPPETLALLGGSIVYPGLLIIGVLTVLLKIIWIRTKLYLLWRLYLGRIFCFLLIVGIFLQVPLLNQWMVSNHPVSIQTIKNWQQSDYKPVFIDLRDKKSYDKVHLLGAINFPFGAGLTHYLKNNQDKRIILYCELGVRSANLHGLEVNASLLKQAVEENRLFYYPGGFNKLMQLGEETPVPVIINLPSDYANYLLKKPNFTEIKYLDDKKPISSTRFIAEYAKITAQHGTPIINSTFSRDSIADTLSQLKATHLYFTTTTKTEAYPLKNCLVLLFILLVTLLTIRYAELFRSLFTKPSAAYIWINLLVSMIVAVVAILLGLFDLFIPFDFDFYAIADNLPMNVGYLLSVYTFFGLILLVHLVYPNKNRLNFLQFKLSNIFAPTQYNCFLKLPAWNELFIVCGIIYFFNVLSYSLSAIFLLSIFLLVPILVDLLLYSFLSQFKNTSTQAFNLLKRCGYSCASDGDIFIQLNTHNELALARIDMTIGKESACVGLFSGKILEDSNDNQPDKAELFLKENELKETNLMNYCHLIRHLLIFFQQDIELNLDRKGNIISLRLYHNHANTRVINRHTLLKHYQILPGAINEERFTSAVFQEVFANPNPLMLDILKLRWEKKGGYLKALHKLGLAIKYNDKTKEQYKEQYIAFSNQIYLDHTFEKAIFSANRWYVWLRKKIVHIKFHLAIDSILQDYYTLIEPRTQIRLTKLTECLHKSQSVSQLKRIINRALTTLYKESAMWQSYSSLLHQHTFQQLQLEATKISCDLSNLINYPSHLSNLLPSYYELSSKHTQLISGSSGIELKQQNNCSYYRSAFLNTETVRTHIRELQLKEWQLISLLLEKLGNKLMLPISLVYLIKDDFRTLPSDHTKLIALLEYRQETWRIQNQWHFPASFSLQDMEKLPNSTWQQDSNPNSNPIESHVIRVAGNQQIITGNAVLFNDNLMLDTLPKGSILVADNLLPEQVIACQHINGIILKKGGYLSHTSIIAREKNIPMIAQFQISAITDKDKLMLHSGNQVNILNNKVLEWEFLEGMATTSDIGNKAQRLALMSQKGFNIPATIILKHRSVEKIYQLASSQIIRDVPDVPDILWREYYEELKELFNLLTLTKSSIIVRSSTNVEDSSHYSYAGIFYSEPNINSTEELISAICASWENFTGRTQIIKEYSEATQLTLNLILQPYIHIKGQLGGVLFTESSISGLMHVEIALGGVEGVTQGDAVLTSLYINERGQSFHATGEKNILSHQQYQALYHLGRELELLCGKPQDIEWIIAAQQLYIIQSRDISNKVTLQGKNMCD